MRILLAPLAVLTALTLTACGGAKDAASSAIDAAQGAASSVAANASSLAAEASSAAAQAGDVDCSAITKEDVASFSVLTQVMAQVRTKDTVKAVASQVISNYTPEKMSAVLGKFQVLAGHPGPGQGDPADAIAYFTTLNDQLGAMTAAPDAVTQAQLDAYAAAVVDVGTALKNQFAINLSISENCTNLG